ncbi:hypothetical protein CENSYa_1096 [Cenarchaeum symbiosum A]|uniref:Uncharacterized protein n=1 Tax=Cenarchaeum symbiosum (strain A) TaxID=414004 RepID=A0RWK8_CENSY|nr:hypothetical protein CENSYa_1096 [Cenarchaeum symbiosum A]
MISLNQPTAEINRLLKKYQGNKDTIILSLGVSVGSQSITKTSFNRSPFTTSLNDAYRGI